MLNEATSATMRAAGLIDIGPWLPQDAQCLCSNAISTWLFADVITNLMADPQPDDNLNFRAQHR